MKKVTEIPATMSLKIKNREKILKVAAYCRVSTEKEEQENNLENQIAYYKNKIESTPNWTLVDIFVDFGISGINAKNRTEFVRMIEMCNKGKIDLIITKSISRFARNTVDCLTYVRNLKVKNIGVIFEKEGINTLDAVSETFLTWFSAFAQSESESLSQNVIRGKRMGYKEGKFAFPYCLYGFKEGENGIPEIIPEQANVVRKIFHMYLEGCSLAQIQIWLEENKIPSPTGREKWGKATVSGILKNEKYMGDVLLQKTYTVDYLTKTKAKNRGELNQYYITDNHTGIVSREIFLAVQEETKKRASLYQGEKVHRYSSQYALTGKVICGECGAKYRRVTWSKHGSKKIVWRCIERLTRGVKKCKNSPTVLEDDLHSVILQSIYEMVSDTDDIKKNIKEIIETVLYKNDECNPQVIKRRIKTYEKEREVLRTILEETDDKEFYMEKIKMLENDLSELNEKLLDIPERKADNIIYQIEQFIDDTELDMNHYFNTLVRNIIESVMIVSEREIKITYVGGMEVVEKL